jgi:hypothetical protein
MEKAAPFTLAALFMSLSVEFSLNLKISKEELRKNAARQRSQCRIAENKCWKELVRGEGLITNFLASSFRNVPGRASCRRPRPRCLYAPDSNPGKRLADRREAQKALWLAGRNLNKSQVFPALEPNGSRSRPGRSSWPDGKAYNAWESSNRVPEKMPDQLR